MEKKILLIGDANSPHIHGLVNAIKKHNERIIIDIMTVLPVTRRPDVDSIFQPSFYNWYCTNFKRGAGKIRLISYLFIIFFQLKKYNTIQIHFVYPYLSHIINTYIFINPY